MFGAWHLVSLAVVHMVVRDADVRLTIHHPDGTDETARCVVNRRGAQPYRGWCDVFHGAVVVARSRPLVLWITPDGQARVTVAGVVDARLAVGPTR